MFYPNDEWIPLRDIANMVDDVLQELRKTGAAILQDEDTAQVKLEGQAVELANDEDRERERERELVSLVWRVCDVCQAATLTKKGKLILLSKALFTRRSNGNVYGDFVKIDLGQIGSSNWIFSEDDFADDKRDSVIPSDEIEILLYPFYRHHILIRRTDFETFVSELTVTEQSAVAEKRKPGRPLKRYEFFEYYNKEYSEGHVDVSIDEVIRLVNNAGGPKIRRSTFHEIRLIPFSPGAPHVDAAQNLTLVA
jgi:hypothetical protein